MRNRQGKLYQYYRCPASWRKHQFSDPCDSRGFPTAQVDAAAWAWISSWLCDLELLRVGLDEYRASLDAQHEPLRERLNVVDDLLADRRAQLERTIDRYVLGTLAREMLVEREQRLRTTIESLEKERAQLQAAFDARTLSDEQIETIVEFAEAVGLGLGRKDVGFAARREIVALLNVTATLVEEDRVKVAYFSCILGEEVCRELHTINGVQVKPYHPFVLTHRIVLESPNQRKKRRTQ